MTEVNEVYTDLCTIYVGFGKLIMEGNNTVVGNITNILGYLNSDVYLSAYGIMCAIAGNSMPNVQEANEVFLEDTLEVWHNNDDKRKMMMEQFALIENDEAMLYRNILYLSEMLRMVQEKAKTRMAAMENVFFGKEMFNVEDKKIVNQPVHLFAAIYEATVDSFDGSDNELVVAINKLLEGTMVKIIDICKDIDYQSLSKIYYECPFCGAKSDSDRYMGKSITLRCKECNKHFHINREIPNIDFWRKNLQDEECKNLDKIVQEVLSQKIETLKTKMPWWLRRLSAKYFNK